MTTLTQEMDKEKAKRAAQKEAREKRKAEREEALRDEKVLTKIRKNFLSGKAIKSSEAWIVITPRDPDIFCIWHMDENLKIRPYTGYVPIKFLNEEQLKKTKICKDCGEPYFNTFNYEGICEACVEGVARMLNEPIFSRLAPGFNDSDPAILPLHGISPYVENTCHLDFVQRRRHATDYWMYA
jgi:hypothetical protein